MAKVIDALVVTLGLDPSGYKKGAADANAAQASLKQSAQAGATATTQATQKAGGAQAKLGREQRQREREEKKRRQDKQRADRKQSQEEQAAADASIDRIKGVGLAVAGAVLGFNTLKGALSAYVGATNQLANLGRVAPTIGTDVKALDKLGDAYKQVTQDKQQALADAQRDTATLAQSQFSYAMHAPDETAKQLRNIRVALFDENNKPREKEQIENDIARALKSQTSDLQTQAMLARKIGMSESFIQLQLVKSNSERDKILASAESTAKATEAGAKGAQESEQAWGRLGNMFKAVGENIVTELSPGVTNSVNWLSDQLDQGSSTSSERTLKYLGLAEKGPNAKKVPKTKWDDAFRAAEIKYHIPQGVLKGIAGTESLFGEHRHSTAGAEGLMQLLPKYHPNAGKDDFADIDEAGKTLGASYKKYKKTYGAETALQLAITEYNAGSRKMHNAITGKIDRHTKKPITLRPESRDYAANVYAYMDSSAASLGSSPAGATPTVNNTTHIEQLNVHTQATDGQGIAATLPDALRRQNLVTQSNSGLR